MPNAKDLSRLGQKVAAAHGWPAAKAFKAYVWSEADQARIARCAADLLKVFPTGPGTFAPLCAALAVQLDRSLDAPVHVVAGTLRVGGAPVLDFPAGTAEYSALEEDQRGHAWIMIGAHIVDPAIFRLAYSADGPAELSRHVLSVFGPDKAVYADQWRRTARLGLTYEPHRVLSAPEVDRLMGAAYQLIAARST